MYSRPTERDEGALGVTVVVYVAVAVSAGDPRAATTGEPGGKPCGVCDGGVTTAVWYDDLWTLHPRAQCSLPGTGWPASREHADSFSDLSRKATRDFGIVAARIERAILSLGGFARVHLYRVPAH